MEQKKTEAIASPAVHFGAPSDVVESPILTDAEKLEALSVWEKDADRLDVATDEGMGPAPDEQPVRPAITAAEDLVRSDEPTVTIHPDPSRGSTDMNRISPDLNRTDKLDTSRIAADTTAVGEDLIDLARQAVEAIRKAADELAATAGNKADSAVSAARAAGTATADSIGGIAGDARSLAEDTFDSLGKTIGRNPIAALAIAAGTGLLLGLFSRSDSRR